MEFTSKNTASTGVVVAPAEVDVATSPAFERDIADAFVTGSGSVVVNFASTTFCDSSGLRVLVNAAKHAQALGRRFEVRNPPLMLRRMAEILGASALLHIGPP
jgi:anti-anti-sigma factor